MDKKLMIYPFNWQVATVARYARLLKGYVLVAVVAPKSYGYEGKDVSFIDGGKPTGIMITSSFQDGLDQCDCILFSASLFPMDLDYYEEKVAQARESGKEVMFTKELADSFPGEQKNIPTGTKVLGKNPVENKISYDTVKNIREISVPVMTILQVGKFCNGLSTQLVMAEKFINEGYRVGCISSSDLGQLFGIHMLPDYINADYISYENKIVNFNHFIFSLVDKEQPDIILLEIEEAILPYSDRITNHFGVIPEIITKAVRADIGVLNLYYGNYDKAHLDDLKAFCQHGLNIEINYIDMANTILEIQERDSHAPIQYISIDLETVLQAIANDYRYDEKCIFYNINDLDRVGCVYQNIVDKLSQNIEIIRTE